MNRKGEFQQAIPPFPNAFGGPLNRFAVCPELVSQGDGHGVHQVGTARLGDVLEFIALRLERMRKVGDNRHELVSELHDSDM